MNENVNLSKILRDCLKGTKLYSMRSPTLMKVGDFFTTTIYERSKKITFFEKKLWKNLFMSEKRCTFVM